MAIFWSTIFLAAVFLHCQGAPIKQGENKSTGDEAEKIPTPDPSQVERYLEKTKNFDGFMSYLSVLPKDEAEKYASSVVESAAQAKRDEPPAPVADNNEVVDEETDDGDNADEQEDADDQEEKPTETAPAEEDDDEETEQADEEKKEDVEIEEPKNEEDDNDNDNGDEEKQNDAENTDNVEEGGEDAGEEAEAEETTDDSDDETTPSTPTEEDGDDEGNNDTDDEESTDEEVAPDDEASESQTTPVAISASTIAPASSTPTSAPVIINSKIVEPPVGEIKTQLDTWFREQLNRRDVNPVDVLTRMLYYIAGNKLPADQSAKITQLLADVEPKMFDVLINKETNPDNKAALQKAIDMVKPVQAQKQQEKSEQMAIFEQHI